MPLEELHVAAQVVVGADTLTRVFEFKNSYCVVS